MTPSPGSTPTQPSCVQACIQRDVSKTIRVDEDVHAALSRLKRDEESFSELLDRLLAERRERVREGAGLWSGSDAAEEAREARQEMKRDVGR